MLHIQTVFEDLRLKKDQTTRPQLTALFTSALILVSSVEVNFLSAKEVGHMAPSSRCASSWKPKVAYLYLNLLAA